MSGHGEHEQDIRPWSARAPQRYLISVAIVVLAVALVWQAVVYIGNGSGGMVPYFLLIGGPVLAGYYVWYFSFRRFGADEARSRR